MKKIILSLPIILIFIITFFIFIYLLQEKEPSKPPSALLNKNLPNFNMVNLFNNNEKISNNKLQGNFLLINFFASWCAPCKAEHPLFFEIKKEFPKLLILGVDHKDKKEDVMLYLDNYGNPYDYIGIDDQGLVGLEFGVFGLPETFIVNTSGKIIYKYLGPLTKKIIKNEIKPLLK